jgi:hypothetical protein
MFECELCNGIFDTNQHLIQHLNKKKKCNIVTDFKCNNCNKYYKYKKTLLDHEEKCNSNAIIKSNNTINFDSLKKLIESNIDIELKADLISNKVSMTINEIKAILNSSISLDDKVLFIKDFNVTTNKNQVINNINNGTVNNTTNNTTNNIQINTFGNENISYLDNEYFKNLIMNNHIEKAYMKLTADIYLHNEHPENKTIKVENINNKFAYVYEDGKWKGILKYELKELLHNKNSKLLKIHYKKLKDIIDTTKKSSINVFFSRQYDDDPHLKDINEKMVLLFYEPKNN